MKKLFVLLSLSLLVVGCQGKNAENSDDIKSFTNKYECYRNSEYTKYDIEHRENGGYRLTEEELKEKKNSPVAVKYTTKKVYDFNESGSKLLKYLDIDEYDYVIDDIDMNKEKEYFEKACEKVSTERYKSCTVELDGKKITVTKANDLTTDLNKDMAEKTTKETIIEAYKDGELFTCK